jgi:hypothetical protein
MQSTQAGPCEPFSNKPTPSDQLSTITQNGNEDLQADFTIQEMLVMAAENKFPKKSFKFGHSIKYYTPILWFFNCERIFNKKPISVRLVCKEQGLLICF